MAKRPLLYISIMYAFGIIVASSMAPLYIIIAVLIGVIAVIPYIMLIHRPGIWVCLLAYGFFAFGVANTWYSYVDANKFAQFANESHVISGRVTDVTTKSDAALLMLEVSAIDYMQQSGIISVNVMKAENKYTYGDEIRFICRPGIPLPPETEGQTDFRPYSYTQGIKAMASINEQGLEYLGNNARFFELKRIGFKIREHIGYVIRQAVPDSQGELLIAILLGDKTGLSDDFLEEVRRSGTAHIIAVSGLHVTLFIMLFAYIARFFSRKYKKAAIIGMLVLPALYVILSHSPSISRAIFMSALYLAATLADRRAEGFTSLAFSAFCILLATPFALFDVRFILSFASILAIMVLNSVYTAKPTIIGKCFYMLLSCIAANIGNALFLAYMFGEISFMGTLVNLLAIPLSSAIVPFACVLYAIGSICLPVAVILGYAMRMLILFLEWLISLGALLPYASIRVGVPDYVDCGIYICICYLVVLTAKALKNKRGVQH